jgi:hypothetical protein
MRVCARVLAAALMTGAIATLLTLPALTSEPGGEHRAVPAPPSSHHRTLRLPALPAPVLHLSARRRVVAHARPSALATVSVAPRPNVAVFNPANVRPTRQPVAPRPAPRPAPSPAPAPAPAPSTPAQPEQREVASEPAPPPASPAPQPNTSDQPCQPSSDEDDGHGHGHAYGHEKQDQQNGSDDAGNGHGNGKANGHDK